MGNIAVCQPCGTQSSDVSPEDINQQSNKADNNIGIMKIDKNGNQSAYSSKNPSNQNRETFLQPFEEQFLKDKTITIEDFKLLKMLGKGSFGKVMMVEHKVTKKLYAMKILQKKSIKTDRQKRHTKTERFVLEKMKHPFIIQLNFAFQNPEKLYLVLDYMNGGELFQHLQRYGRFKEEVARFYAAEILLAIEHLHQNNIFYRDLKPENVLMGEDGHIKIADFGLSFMTQNDSEFAKSMCGTPEYLAPEIFTKQQKLYKIQNIQQNKQIYDLMQLFIEKGHDKTVDWWSLGALIYEMLTGLPPFYSEDKKKMFQNVISKQVPMPQYLSSKAISILKSLLVIDPCKRLGYGPKDAQTIKEHPFFEGLDFEKLLKKELPSPLKFSLKGPDDLKYFDKHITKQEARDTPVQSNMLNQNIAFSNFTYIGKEGKMRSKEDNSHLIQSPEQNQEQINKTEFKMEGVSFD